MQSLINKELNARQLSALFAVACTLFIIPLILADNLYIDDYARALTAQDHWFSEGRPLLSLFYAVLSMSGGALNMFPLPLLVATLVVAAALASLTRHYFHQPRLADALVVLPLWYCPFFLQNLSYQYDGPGIALGLAAAICSITYRSPVRMMQIWLPSLLIASSLLFYQILINVLLGLYCVEVFRAVQERWSASVGYRYLKEKLYQLAGGLVMYFIVAWYWLRHSERMALVALDPALFGELAKRLHEVSQSVGLLMNDANRWLCLLLLGATALCFTVLGARILCCSERLAERLIWVSVYVAAALALLVNVGGAGLMFAEFAPAARVLMGLAPLLVGCFYLLRGGLQIFGRQAALVLALPLMCMLSFSFAYGRVLQVQRTLCERLALGLSLDIAAHAELQRLPVLYLQDTWQSDNWLPGSYGALQRVPALRFVLNIDYWLLPEIMPRYGVVTLTWLPDNDPGLLPPLPPPIVDNHFYAIYRGPVAGYVVMKKLHDTEVMPFTE